MRVDLADKFSPTFKTSQAKELYQKALLHSDKSNWNGAILELNRALEYEPRNPTLLLDLGVALGELRHWNEAIKILKRAVEISPNSMRAHYNLGVTLDRANPGKGLGVAEFRKALRLDPKDVSTMINLAISLGNEDFQEAKRLLDRAITLDAKNDHAYFNLGLLLKSSGDQKQAVLAFQKAITLNPAAVESRRQLLSILIAREQWDQVLEQCQEILKLDPSDWRTRYSFGQTLIRKGNAEEGKSELQKSQLMRQSQQNRETAERLLGRALSDLNNGAVEEAIKNLRSALEIEPNSVHAHMYLGVALAASKEIGQGIAELNKAIELNPSDARVHHNLGTVLLQAGQVDAASREFERALELDPYFPETYNNLGLILSNTKQIQKAVEHFRMASQLNPQYVEALFNLGLALQSMKRPDDAAEAFRRAAELAPDNAQVHYAFGMALKDKGDLKGAEAALGRANALQQSRSAAPKR